MKEATHMLRILKISALITALLLFGSFHMCVIAQPVVDIIPQLPWEYDPGTGTQVGPWEMELVLTDSAAPIVAYGVGFRGVYEGDDDVPYFGFVVDVVTPFLEWDITGTPAETADYVSPINLSLSNATSQSCNTTSCAYYFNFATILSTSAPFTEVDFSAGVSIGRLKYFEPDPIPGLISDVQGSNWKTSVDASPIRSVVTYNDGTEAFIPSSVEQIDHSLTPANSFRRGDVNGNQVINITDAMLIFFYAFLGDPITCLDAADVNDDGAIDISDPIYILLDLYEGGPSPPPPGNCGVDLTPDALDCAVGLCT
jgi:hypothetical protein